VHFTKNDLNVQDTVNNLNIDKIIEKPVDIDTLKNEVTNLTNDKIL
jgi:hypothetical protein